MEIVEWRGSGFEQEIKKGFSVGISEVPRYDVMQALYATDFSTTNRPMKRYDNSESTALLKQ